MSSTCFENEPCPQAEGFTLIELSIVLVIIGLIVGGVLVGRDLIKAAELRSVMTDVQKFITAINTFRGKYDCLPGDCANATTVFGTDSLGCPAGGGTTGTCNGDGNGQIGDLTGWNPESYRVWQQLSQASLIEGRYSGVAGNGSCSFCANVGVNVPGSKLGGNTGYALYYRGSSYFGSDGDSIYYFDGNYGNMISFGTVPVGQNFTAYATLTPLEAQAFDNKVDDGKPATGMITPWRSIVDVNCSTADDTTAVYNISYSGPACALIFKTGL